MYKFNLADSESKIKQIQDDANKKIELVQNEVLSSVEDAFRSIGWNYWTHDQHMSDGQYKRLYNALNDKRMDIVSIDYEKQSGIISSSEVYEVSGSGCSCSDFEYRGLPCKHMYFLLSALMSNEAEIVAMINQGTSKVPVQQFDRNIFKESNRQLLFVLTGKFEKGTRKEFTKIVEGIGGKVISSISSRTDYLITGANAGSKLQQALDLDIPILSENEFLSIINK